MTKTLQQKFIPLVIIMAAATFATGMVLVAHAQTTNTAAVSDSPAAGITFPVAELGNCADKLSCRAYCNDPINMAACVDFSKKHGLTTAAEAERGKRFANELNGQGGPGGCKTPTECKQFCENVANLNTCVEFAKKFKINDKKTNEAEKLTAFLKSGGTTPGNCDSAASCRTYCADLTHATECRTFAEKMGLTASEGKNPVPAGQFQRLEQLAKDGKTPGACTTNEGCKTYCSDTTHRSECIAFGKVVGFIGEQQADALLKVGGVGPGGCTTADGCRLFCNNEANRDVCYKFAEENNLISKEDLKKTEDGLVRFRQGLQTAPPEVVSCLKASVGENLITDIQSGKLTPGPEIGEKVKVCFEKFGKKVDTTEEFKKAPVDVLSCLKDKVGDRFTAIQSGRATMTPEIADTVRVCHERAALLMQFAPAEATGRTIPGTPPTKNEGDAARAGLILRGAPEVVQTCIREKIGGSFDDVVAGETPTEDMKRAVSLCYESFKPTDPATRPVNVAPTGNVVPTRFAPNVLSCFKENLSASDYESVARGVKPAGAEGVIARCLGQNTSSGVKPATEVRMMEPIERAVPPTTNTVPFRPAVMTCLKENLSIEEYQRILSGTKPESAALIISKCAAVAEPTIKPPIVRPDDGAVVPSPVSPQGTTVKIQPTATSNSTAPSSVFVSIKNFSFTPALIVIKKGGTVVWTNGDFAPHTVSSPNGLFESGNLDAGASFKHTFTTAGTFEYLCSYHPNMQGMVQVVE